MLPEAEDNRIYIAIDLKSFYASVECVERGLEPLDTNLVVADPTRTEKTICLAVSPGLKTYGIPGRPRLFEVVQTVKSINVRRKSKAPGQSFTGRSNFVSELTDDPSLELSYIVAPPRMALYMRYSTDIYKIYLKYIAPEDIHVYSCDEVFMDVTSYLKTYQMSAHELAIKMIREVMKTTGITATAGIGTNLFLCKVAMDIVAKHMPMDRDGVRIAELNERTFREKLWNHTPLTDFWRIGAATERKLNQNAIYTLGDIARESEINEDYFYRTFGINAELLIDHAWGWEPATIDSIKQYKPEARSLSSGQVLMCPYSSEDARIVVREMTDALALDLVAKGLVTDQIVLTVGYENLKDGETYAGETRLNRYGKLTPKHAHGTANLPRQTASSQMMINATLDLYDRTIDKSLLVRRITVAACKLIPESDANRPEENGQLNLFTDFGLNSLNTEEEKKLAKEKALQKAELEIKERFGKNAILKGTSLQKAATGRERNAQIGGHKA
ncbi:MAG: DNA methylase [Lachnospiraceae bacterium]|nr:DNA methylase [Lachnospiraceae bacterium]